MVYFSCVHIQSHKFLSFLEVYQDHQHCTNMNISLLLLYCTEILAALLFIPGRTSADNSSTPQPNSPQDFRTTAGRMSDADSSMSKVSPTAVSEFSSSPSFAPSPDPKPTKATTKPPTTTKTTASTKSTTTNTRTSVNLSEMLKECRPVFFVSAGLIIACAVLLISTLFLAWRTCHLSRRLKTLNTNGDLISTSEYWMGTARKDKSKPQTEAKETTVLMSDLGQTQEEVSNGTPKEDGGKVKEDGQKGEEKEVGDPANGEEAAAAENSSSSKPQEEADNSQSVKAAAASSSEGAEEPKDVL